MCSRNSICPGSGCSHSVFQSLPLTAFARLASGWLTQIVADGRRITIFVKLKPNIAHTTPTSCKNTHHPHFLYALRSVTVFRTTRPVIIVFRTFPRATPSHTAGPIHTGRAELLIISPYSSEVTNTQNTNKMGGDVFCVCVFVRVFGVDRRRHLSQSIHVENIG